LESEEEKKENETKQEEAKKVEAKEKENKINAVGHSELKLSLPTMAQIAKSTDDVTNKIAFEKIKARYTKLQELLKCI